MLGYSRNFVGSSPSLSLLMTEGASGGASHPYSSKLVETTEESQAILSPRPRSLDTFSSNIPDSLAGTFKSWNEESIKRRSDGFTPNHSSSKNFPSLLLFLYFSLDIWIQSIATSLTS